MVLNHIDLTLTLHQNVLLLHTWFTFCLKSYLEWTKEDRLLSSRPDPPLPQTGPESREKVLDTWRSPQQGWEQQRPTARGRAAPGLCRAWRQRRTGRPRPPTQAPRCGREEQIQLRSESLKAAAVELELKHRPSQVQVTFRNHQGPESSFYSYFRLWCITIDNYIHDQKTQSTKILFSNETDEKLNLFTL